MFRQSLSIFYFATVCLGQLFFLNAEDARQFGEAAIDFRFFALGKPVYGQQLLARLRRDPNNGCSPSRADWRIGDAALPFATIITPNDCGLRTKIINSQYRDDLFLLIALPSVTNTTALANLSSLNSLSIDIPILLISEAVGARLLVLADQTPPLRLVTAMPQRDSVILRFVIVGTDPAMFAFLEETREYIEQFDNRLTVDFVFAANGPSSDAGRLQATCNCLPPGRAMAALGAYNKNCVANGVTAADCLQSQVELRQQHAMMLCLMIHATPVSRQVEPGTVSHILINDFVYNGGRRSEELFEAICSAFISSPDNCLYIRNRFVANRDYKEFRSDGELDKYLVVAVICLIEIALLFMIGLLLAVIYSRIYGGLVYERVPEIVKDSMLVHSSFARDTSRHIP